MIASVTDVSKTLKNKIRHPLSCLVDSNAFVRQIDESVSLFSALHVKT